jgi:glycosyltransferase involved in cell wall biosynthesis
MTPIGLLDIDVSEPIREITGLDRYVGARALIRWRGDPVGSLELPVSQGRIDPAVIRARVVEACGNAILKRALEAAILCGHAGCPIEELFEAVRPDPDDMPGISVAICTRDRPDDLMRALDAVRRQAGGVSEILSIDNAPSEGTLRERMESALAEIPGSAPVRYIHEPRPGLDWARNRAIQEATCDIIAFTDDDTEADPGWARAIAHAFEADPTAMAVTGLVVPLELETEAQLLFELLGGFGRGYQRRRVQVPEGARTRWHDYGTGDLGTGANMAFRKSVFEQIGGFDPALDVGTPTNGAGDLDILVRVLKAGHAIAYEPAAIIRHRHRREMDGLHRQIRNNGSFYAMLVKSGLADPKATPQLMRMGAYWLWHGNLKPLMLGWVAPRRIPASLYRCQLMGSFAGLTSYFRSRRHARKIEAAFASHPDAREPLPAKPAARAAQLVPAPSEKRPGMAVRRLELSAFGPIEDVAAFASTRVFVTCRGVLVGHVNIENRYGPIRELRLASEIAQRLTYELLALSLADGQQFEETETIGKLGLGALSQRFLHRDKPASIRATPYSGVTWLPDDIRVSIVLATYDRPDDLREALTSLTTQATKRPVEIIVVDNHPASGLTPPIIAGFKEVTLVSEVRQGLAYARNAGICAARGEIIVTTDDDVVAPSDWLERVIAPLSSADVSCVTGNVLPRELETHSQRIFEAYGEGGLGRGYRRRRRGRAWFDELRRKPVPTWQIGCTANMAVRASVIVTSEVGLMDEALGPGMPSGVGEDIYLFYKILKSGGTIVYEPTAWLWHKHRRTMDALKRQIHGYSKGFTSYQLTTLNRDRDLRALLSLFIILPKYRLAQVWRWLWGDRSYPLSLILLEWRGNLMGWWALPASRARVRRLGRSGPLPPEFGKWAHPAGPLKTALMAI